MDRKYFEDLITKNYQLNSKDLYTYANICKNEGDIEKAFQIYSQVIQNSDLWYIDKLNSLKFMSQFSFQKGDIYSALKFAVLASICTASPRADICNLLGALYVATNNLKWAEIWYKNALIDDSVASEREGMDNNTSVRLEALHGLLAISSQDSLKHLETENYINDILSIDKNDHLANFIKNN